MDLLNLTTEKYDICITIVDVNDACMARKQVNSGGLYAKKEPLNSIKRDKGFLFAYEVFLDHSLFVLEEFIMSYASYLKPRKEAIFEEGI